MHGVLFTGGIVDSERVERAKWLNEIAHRLTHKIFVMNKKPDAEWTDAEIQEIFGMNIEKPPPIEADVNAAIETSYHYVLENESAAVSVGAA